MSCLLTWARRANTPTRVPSSSRNWNTAPCAKRTTRALTSSSRARARSSASSALAAAGPPDPAAVLAIAERHGIVLTEPVPVG